MEAERPVNRLQVLIPLSAVTACFVVAPPAVAGEDNAEPAEVVEKVQKSAALLREQGDSALSVLRDKTSGFMWKDAYCS
jgi:hypothetical protein